MKKISLKTLLPVIALLAFSAQEVLAQQEEKKVKKIEIVTKTIDENGEEKMTKIVREGEDASDAEIEKLLADLDGEFKLVNVEIEKNDDGTSKIIITKTDEAGQVTKSKITGTDKQGSDHAKIIITTDEETSPEKEQSVKIIKKKSLEGGATEIIIEKEMDETGEMILIEEDGIQDGSVIILEEETTEETDSDGKTVKKTVKKKKIIKKKEGQ